MGFGAPDFELAACHSTHSSFQDGELYRPGALDVFDLDMPRPSNEGEGGGADASDLHILVALLDIERIKIDADEGARGTTAWKRIRAWSM